MTALEEEWHLHDNTDMEKENDGRSSQHRSKSLKQTALGSPNKGDRAAQRNQQWGSTPGHVDAGDDMFSKDTKDAQVFIRCPPPEPLTFLPNGNDIDVVPEDDMSVVTMESQSHAIDQYRNGNGFMDEGAQSLDSSLGLDDGHFSVSESLNNGSSVPHSPNGGGGDLQMLAAADDDVSCETGVDVSGLQILGKAVNPLDHSGLLQAFSSHANVPVINAATLLEELLATEKANAIKARELRRPVSSTSTRSLSNSQAFSTSGGVGSMERGRSRQIQQQSVRPSTAPVAGAGERRGRSLSRSNIYAKTASSAAREKSREPKDTAESGLERGRSLSATRKRSASGERSLTIPQGPNLRTSAAASRRQPIQSTEERELAEALHMKQRLNAQLNMNKHHIESDRMQRAARLSTAGGAAGMKKGAMCAVANTFGGLRSAKPLTQPESPALKTTSRFGERTLAACGSQVEHIGFSPCHPAKPNVHKPTTHAHGSSTSLNSSAPHGPTIPKPFKLHGGGNPTTSHPEAPSSDSLSFGEAINRMNTSLPERFRPKATPKPVPVQMKLTHPHEPHFATDVRAMRTSKPLPLSHEQEEEKIMAEAAAHQFKARPFDKAKFGVCGESGVFRPTHSAKQLTLTEPFSFEVRKPQAAKPLSSEEQQLAEIQSHQFKAMPMPHYSEKVKVSTAGTVDAENSTITSVSRSLTVPVSPALATKARSYQHIASTCTLTTEERELELAKEQKFKALPLPDYNKLAHVGVRTSTQHLTITEPEPFELCTSVRGDIKADREKTRRAQEEAKEAAMRQVHALPPPDMSGAYFRPKPSNKPLTETKEFRLEGIERHAAAEVEMAAKVAEEAAHLSEMSNFHAISLPESTYEFVEEKPKPVKQLTVPKEFTLPGDERVEQRKKFDEDVKARIQQAEEEAAQAAAEKELEEQLALKLERNKPISEGGFQFKATPITWTSAVPMSVPTVKPLTLPMTPHFATAARVRARHEIA